MSPLKAYRFSSGSDQCGRLNTAAEVRGLSTETRVFVVIHHYTTFLCTLQTTPLRRSS